MTEALRDPDTRREIEACVRLGISPRRFGGWEPAIRTWTNPDGYTVTRREPEWDDVDQAIVLAHLANEDVTCPGCGGYLDQTMSTDFGWRVDEPVCHRCAAHTKHRDAHPKPKPGVLLISTPVPVPTD